MRVGWGIDAHRFAPEGFVLLGGVIVDDTRGVIATSDGDVAAHALTDAVLGAAALGDLGEFYPSSDPRWTDVDSLVILRDAVGRAAAAGFHPASADVTIIAQSIRIAPHRDTIRTAFAAALGIPIRACSVKATTTDSMGFIGRDEGIAAMAVVVLEESPVASRQSPA
jgi:2-C-methyl-D-erythritol 2,4-cyclodiphosphate synthase